MCKLLIKFNISREISLRLLNEPIAKSCFEHITSGNYSEKELEYLHQYLTYGGFYAIDLWLTNGCDTPVEEFAEIITSFLSQTFNANI